MHLAQMMTTKHAWLQKGIILKIRPESNLIKKIRNFISPNPTSLNKVVLHQFHICNTHEVSIHCYSFPTAA